MLKLKLSAIFCTLLLVSVSYGQNNNRIPGDVSGKWDTEHSAKNIRIDTLRNYTLPVEIQFKGHIVEALQWQDKGGQNLLLLTETGEIKNVDKANPEETQRAELYAYLYTRKPGEKTYSLSWKIFDYTTCCDLDILANFYPESLTITDLDKNGFTEVTVIYSLFCGGGVDPANKKIILYEQGKKYAMRGESIICYETNDGEVVRTSGTAYKADTDLKQRKDFFEFCKKRWDICDNEYGNQ